MIRQFQPEDSVSCCSLIRQCLATDDSLPSETRGMLQNLETPESMQQRAKLFFVAVFESAGKILGVAGLDLNEIRLLCVSPGYQRKGIGKALLEYIKSMVPDTLFSDVFVYSSLQGKAFYRACGFQEKGSVTIDIGASQMNAVFMALPLRQITSQRKHG